MFVPIAIEDFTQMITNAVANAVAAVTPNREDKAQAEPTNAGLLTRKDTANILHVAPKTLNEWTKEGKIVAHRLGGRVYYRQSDIDTALKQIQTTSKQSLTPVAA
jgi:excisionase family DNA binding protein